MMDQEDRELAGLFPAGRFVDATEEPAKPRPGIPMEDAPRKEPAPEAGGSMAPDARWAMLRGNEPRKLMDCAKTVAALAVSSGVLFWWQSAELLADSAAWPAYIVLAGLSGLSLGRFLGNK